MSTRVNYYHYSVYKHFAGKPENGFSALRAKNTRLRPKYLGIRAACINDIGLRKKIRPTSAKPALHQIHDLDQSSARATVRNRTRSGKPR